MSHYSIHQSRPEKLTPEVIRLFLCNRKQNWHISDHLHLSSTQRISPISQLQFSVIILRMRWRILLDLQAMTYWFGILRCCSCRSVLLLHIVASVRATIPVICYWALFFFLNNKSKVTFWICRWWRFIDKQVWVVLVHGAGLHFSRNSCQWIYSWFNRARQQSRWSFIIIKWTSKIGENSALIHGPFYQIW